MKKIWNIAEGILTALAVLGCVVYWAISIWNELRETKERIEMKVKVQSELARQKGYDEGWAAAADLYDNN